MKKNIGYFLVFLLLVLVSGCEENLIEEEYSNTPIDNYEAFWNEFDRFYGAFEAKNINWDSLKPIYEKELSSLSTNQQLFGSIAGLLKELNDGHADLYAPGVGYYRSWSRRSKSLFSDLKDGNSGNITFMQNMVRTSYLRKWSVEGEFSGWKFFYGAIPYSDYKIGYICIPTFNISNFPNDFIQAAVDSFNKLDAVIVDLRFNGGGKTEAFVFSLNCFASEEKCYLKSNLRDGTGYSDFTELDEHVIHPHTDCLKNKPVAVLMNAFSASSSDHFILGMKSQSYVITVGDTSCGAFSSVLERVLPNGWKFRLGAQVIYNPDGTLMTDSRGSYIEGIGIPPDYYVLDQLKEIRKGNDVPLNVALEKLSQRVNR